jgi:hypothetical protein
MGKSKNFLLRYKRSLVKKVNIVIEKIKYVIKIKMLIVTKN